jgi:hypothetical protein
MGIEILNDFIKSDTEEKGKMRLEITMSQVYPKYETKKYFKNIPNPIIKDYKPDFLSFHIKITPTKINNNLSLISFIFENCEIIDNQYKGEKGMPDFKIKKGEKEIFVELKLNGDAMSQSQLNWPLQNNKKNCFFLFLNIKDSETPNIVPPQISGKYSAEKIILELFRQHGKPMQRQIIHSLIKNNHKISSASLDNHLCALLKKGILYQHSHGYYEISPNYL